MKKQNNISKKVIKDFGLEWQRFNQSEKYFKYNESKKIFDKYFSIFPFSKINKNSIGMDL